MVSDLGEAKNRKKRDPYYGKVPKSGKGLVISNPLKIDGTSVLVKNSELDPLELRRSILFWDKLSWPQNNGIAFGSKIEADYLESVGLLERPKYKINGDIATGVAESFLRSYFENEAIEPGQWSLSTGDNALILKSGNFSEGRGVSVDLFRSIPIPEHDVPLEEILRFKDKRLNEVRSLVVAIDEFYSNWISSEDKEHQLNLAKRKIEQACMDMVKVAKEDKNKFRLSSWEIGFGINALGALGAAEVGGRIGQNFGFEELGKLIGAGASTITLSKAIGLKKEANSNSPFRFAASLELDTI